jgi:uncharacterized protein (TIGR04222 family)
MDGLFDNFLANMRGLDFLVLYLILACIVVGGVYFLIALQDTTGEDAPATPAVIDPYELAYLRGGVNEVIRTAIYALRQHALFDFEKGKLRAATYRGQELNAIERSVFQVLSFGPKIAALFADRDLRGKVEQLCSGYEKRLSAQGLLTPPEVRRMGKRVLFVGGALLIGLAGYKTCAALLHGHSNLGFLFVAAAGACVALIFIYRKMVAANASTRGKAYLAQIRLAYSGHLGAVFGAAPGGSAGRVAIGGSALLMVGLFGFSILKGTPDAALAQAFAQSSGSGGDGGGGCGGGGGGGCGGCGGGGGD